MMLQGVIGLRGQQMPEDPYPRSVQRHRGDMPAQQKTRTFRHGVLVKTQNKKLSLSTELSALFDAWQFPTLTWGD
ncbi:hypothetical protein, partial [Klebsiella variicola]|uniref:hypothetical protein n=1 Tax=Klebsiella variicola TaxID=244366 RepID=UPI0039EEB34D